jgi:hypothetical protein
VRYPDLVKFRAIGLETQSLVEAGSRHLRVQVDLREATLCGEVHEAAHDGEARPGAAMRRQYGDATNLTGGFQAACANRVTFRGISRRKHEYVRDDRIEFVPLVAFRNPLFFDENSPSHVLDLHAIVLPRRELHDVIRSVARRHRAVLRVLM